MDVFAVAVPFCSGDSETAGFGPKNFMITEKKTGVKKMPNKVTPIIPLNTAVPSACRISAPGPLATTKGNTPSVNANEVIKIGRSRSRAASVAAVNRSRPRSISCLANSTIKMAFLHARPTSTTNPIWVKILSSIDDQPRREWGCLCGETHQGDRRNR